MYKIAVVDRSADSRSRIVKAIEQNLLRSAEEFNFVPRVSLLPLTIDEIKFHGAPEVCIVGPELTAHSLADVHKIRSTYPAASLWVKAPAGWDTLGAIEQLARCGVDDVLTEELTSRVFLQKLIILAQKKAQPHQGRLVLVTGGKGGAGITSVTAALGERLLDAGKRVVLVDFDFETQDLSRFLQARPYLNENLQLLLDERSVVSEESVRAALVQVWLDEPNLLLMPPAAESRALYGQGERVVRTLLSVFEQLDAMCGCILVDAGCAGGVVLEMLYRIADRVLYVVPNDPAALFASVDRVRRYRCFLSEAAQFALVVNENRRGALNAVLLKEEFNKAAELADSAWVRNVIPYCKDAQRWPGSGASMAAVGGAPVRRAVEEIGLALGLVDQSDVEVPAKATGMLASIKRVAALLSRLRGIGGAVLPEGRPTAALNGPGAQSALPQGSEKLMLPEAPGSGKAATEVSMS